MGLLAYVGHLELCFEEMFLLGQFLNLIFMVFEITLGVRPTPLL